MDAHEEYVNDLVARSAEAARAWSKLDQAATDRIVEAIFMAAFARRFELARISAEETGIGLLEHKILKNSWSTVLVYEDLRRRKTVGVLEEDEIRGLTTVAEPRGPILALTPVTNPTSTTIFKCLICAKTRNPVIFSPHQAARRSSRRAAEICLEAALEAGAPPDCIQWLKKSRKEILVRIMSHRRLALILATGTGEVVKMAQRSGNPVLGSGPGNVPVYVHGDADLALAARSIVHSKTFDNGVVCASEQALIVTPEVDRLLRPLLEERGSHFCSGEEAEKLRHVSFDPVRRGMAASVVGRSAAVIAEMAGFPLSDDIRLLIARCAEVGRDHYLSHEILAPILAYYVVEALDEAIETARKVSKLGGVGHTMSVWTQDLELVERFSRAVPAGRICVNQPATQGALGGMYNTLDPSLTLGTGSGGGNLVTDNISVNHLITYQRILRRRENSRWLDIGRDYWMDGSITAEEALKKYNRFW